MRTLALLLALFLFSLTAFAQKKQESVQFSKIQTPIDSLYAHLIHQTENALEAIDLVDQLKKNKLLQKKAKTKRRIQSYQKQSKALTQEALVLKKEAIQGFLAAQNIYKQNFLINRPLGKTESTKLFFLIEQLGMAIQEYANAVRNLSSELLASDTIPTLPHRLGNNIFVETGSKVSSYGFSRPIPKNAIMPYGLVYKIQLGAFTKEVEPEKFVGFSPIYAEITPDSVFRYTAGMFVNYETAQSVRAKIAEMGFNQAFITAYKNGERISLRQARELENSDTTVKANIVETIEKTEELEGQYNAKKVEGLFFTVQVGVYSNLVKKGVLMNLKPLVYHQTETGKFRYSSGIFKTLGNAEVALTRVKEFGIADAFVSAYYNGQRVSIEKANFLLLNNGLGIVTDLPETRDIDFKKPVSQEVTFKIQLGVYNENKEFNLTSDVIALSQGGVQILQENGLNYYTIGNYSDYNAAKALLARVHSNGFEEAFIVAFNNQSKISVKEALLLQNQ